MHGDLDDRLPHTDELLALSNALGGGGFDETRKALLRRIQGGLAGLTPLTRTGSAAEGKAFGMIVDRLTNFDGFLGGAGMAEALTRRAKTVWSSGGQDASFDMAVQRLATRLPAPAQRIGYLLDLATSPFRRNKLSVLIRQVATEFESITACRPPARSSSRRSRCAAGDSPGCGAGIPGWRRRTAPRTARRSGRRTSRDRQLVDERLILRPGRSSAASQCQIAERPRVGLSDRRRLMRSAKAASLSRSSKTGRPDGRRP
ncbi:hypothetical protein [Azospirillum brasilense]|uniref:hypothetical protein n=1 Tax=Azospirillum brasilense TaxID=192 RepID=UPI000705AA18|nr:hypothetical protein [Azospirillum brasilense]ALJ38000.1 hypothetical protein AMK58_13865 [Azospirillum brasilense]